MVTGIIRLQTVRKLKTSLFAIFGIVLIVFALICNAYSTGGAFYLFSDFLINSSIIVFLGCIKEPSGIAGRTGNCCKIGRMRVAGAGQNRRVLFCLFLYLRKIRGESMEHLIKVMDLAKFIIGENGKYGHWTVRIWKLTKENLLLLSGSRFRENQHL